MASQLTLLRTCGETRGIGFWEKAPKRVRRPTPDALDRDGTRIDRSSHDMTLLVLLPLASSSVLVSTSRAASPPADEEPHAIKEYGLVASIRIVCTVFRNWSLRVGGTEKAVIFRE
jgi:hypothetical protein